MRFHVFRQDRGGKVQKIAETYWVEDAVTMCENWHSTKIVDSQTDTIVHVKNWHD